MTLSDINAAMAALIVHVMLAYALVKAPAYVRKHPNTIQFDVRKIKVEPPELQPIPPPPPMPIPPAPPPPKKVRVKHEPQPPTPPKAPIPNETPPPKEPPKEPPKPIFGATMSSTSEGGSFSVPVGNTTITDPKNVGKPSQVKPLPPAPPAAAPAPVFKAASPLEIKEYPEPDESSCQIPSRLYPEEARDQGIEGVTQLRVEIDAQGKVHGVKVIGPAGKTLDALAVQWMKTRCRFKAAKNTANQPISAMITYTFKWQIDR